MENSTKVIGFAREYYTLWSMICIKSYADVNGKRIHVSTRWDYTYIKNLSKDLDKAIEKVTSECGIKNPDVDESLRGVTSRSFTRYEYRAMSYLVFPYGKLKHESIIESDDVWQLTRIYNGGGHIGGEQEFNTLIPTKRRVLARRRLIELGELQKIGGEYLTKREIEHKKLADQSFWLHNDGERLDLKLKICSKTHYESAFGMVYVVKYTDDNGMVYYYRGCNQPYVENEEESFLAKATIKHDTYKGIKQTMIQRVKVLSQSLSNL